MDIATLGRMNKAAHLAYLEEHGGEFGDQRIFAWQAGAKNVAFAVIEECASLCDAATARKIWALKERLA